MKLLRKAWGLSRKTSGDWVLVFFSSFSGREGYWETPHKQSWIFLLSVKTFIITIIFFISSMRTHVAAVLHQYSVLMCWYSKIIKFKDSVPQSRVTQLQWWDLGNKTRKMQHKEDLQNTIEKSSPSILHGLLCSGHLWKLAASSLPEQVSVPRTRWTGNNCYPIIIIANEVKILKDSDT